MAVWMRKIERNVEINWKIGRTCGAIGLVLQERVYVHVNHICLKWFVYINPIVTYIYPRG